MLESQNEKIGSITVKIEEANDDVEKGNEQLTTAIEKGKSIRRVNKIYFKFNSIMIKH